MKRLLLLSMALLLCACAMKSQEVPSPGMTYLFRGVPVTANLSFLKEGGLASLAGTLANSGSQEIVMAIATKMDATRIEIRVNDGVMSYDNVIRASGQEGIPAEYFSLDLPSGSTQHIEIRWKDVSEATKDSVSLTPIGPNGPVGDTLHINMRNGMPISQAD